MKNLKIFSLILTVISLTIIQSCVIEGDDDVIPTDARSKFLGEWKVNESCTRGNYMATISLDPGNSTQVLIDNFGNPGPGYDPAVGLVVSNTIKVSSQNIGEGWTVSGQGNYQQNGSILWTYSLVVSGYKEDCTAEFTR